MNILRQSTLRQNCLVPFLLAAMLVLAACAGAGDPPAGSGSAVSDSSAVQSESSSESTADENAAAENAQEDAASEAETNSADAPASAESAVEAMTKLNLNTVSGDELLNTIPDFGDRMVHEFHEYRPYISIQQFRREIGKYVDEAQVAAYEQYVYVPVNVNESDAETLKQLPGVDDAVAEELIAARPYESNAGFLEKLGEVISAEDAAAAEAYLESE